jgi:hypothetical protein
VVRSCPRFASNWPVAALAAAVRTSGDDPDCHHRRDLHGDTRHAAARLSRRRASTYAKGERLIWLEPHVLNKLRALREPGDDYSDVISRLVGVGHGSLNRS